MFPRFAQGQKRGDGADGDGVPGWNRGFWPRNLGTVYNQLRDHDKAKVYFDAAAELVGERDANGQLILDKEEPIAAMRKELDWKDWKMAMDYGDIVWYIGFRKGEMAHNWLWLYIYII